MINGNPVSTIRGQPHLRSTSGLKAVRLGGKVRYRRSDLAEFIELCSAG